MKFSRESILGGAAIVAVTLGMAEVCKAGQDDIDELVCGLENVSAIVSETSNNVESVFTLVVPGDTNGDIRENSVLRMQNTFQASGFDEVSPDDEGGKVVLGSLGDVQKDGENDSIFSLDFDEEEED